jgi:hypothetical protein
MLFVIRHENKYGDSTYVCECDHIPTKEEANKKLILNYEPDKGEWISIEKTEIIDLNED